MADGVAAGELAAAGVPAGDPVCELVADAVRDRVTADVGVAVATGDVPTERVGVIVDVDVGVAAGDQVTVDEDVKEDVFVTDAVLDGAVVSVPVTVDVGVEVEGLVREADTDAVAEEEEEAVRGAATPKKAMLSKLMVPVDTAGSGLGANLTQRAAWLSAPTPNPVEPAVAFPVAR